MNGPPPAQRALVDALARTLPHACVFETHISWVLVTPAAAYKVKKAVRLPFLDWRDAAVRRACCEEEVRLNRRYAPGLYTGVAAITGDPAAPRIGGAGPVLEYAVAMAPFSQSALWTKRVAAGRLGADEAAELGMLLAAFHARTEPCAPGWPWGTGAAVLARTAADLAELSALLPDAPASFDALSRWDARARRLRRLFDWRRLNGHVRECHGDLHLGNVLTLDGAVLPFDGIEFDPALRWTDTMQDFAFAWMDLRCHGRADLAAALLNAYLDAGGDHGGLAVLRYYAVQRALVRAKVAALSGDATLARRYLAFAVADTHIGRGALLVTHGLSGSGKSTLCAALAGPLGALVVRSDVERRRFLGARYTEAAHRATYAMLRRLVRRGLRAGLCVLVDAACLQPWQRDTFASLAQARRVPFVLLHVDAPDDVLRRRVRVRALAGTDASEANEAVLERQLATVVPLLPREREHALAARGGVDGIPALLAALSARGFPPTPH